MEPTGMTFRANWPAGWDMQTPVSTSYLQQAPCVLVCTTRHSQWLQASAIHKGHTALHLLPM